MSLVSLAEIKENNLKEAIAQSLTLIDYSFKKDIQKVVIKINACYYWDATTGQTTDPAFVEALVGLIREHTSSDVDISLIESDASAMKCKYAYKFLGFEKLAKTLNVKLVNLSEEECDDTKVSCDGETFDFKVPKIIKEADLRINLPKIKYTNKPIYLTCALKNIYGCNPYPQKYKYHPKLGPVIISLNKLMKFDLCLIDANVVSGVQPKRMGLVMASTDLLAIDVAAARIAGLNPNRLKYFKLGKHEGIGSMKYIAKGAPISRYKNMYPKMSKSKKAMLVAYRWALKLKLGKRLGVE
jgi:uncharacterized protein (DUF362 family)